jgi:hypothetical protein
VTWPGGKKQQVIADGVDRLIEILEDGPQV